MTTMTALEIDRDALAERLVAATTAGLELFAVHLGGRLGFYDVLSEHPDVTAAELSEATGVRVRYTREWLEQQAVAGFLTATGDDEATRRFTLPAAHREVFADPDSSWFVAPLAQLLAGVGQTLPQVGEAYRHGSGLPFSAYGADVREGQSAMNRPAFLNELAAEWLPALPDVHRRLLAAPPARVADVGCGTGWSSVALAGAYPGVHVDGFDLDVASIDEARDRAAQAGLDDRLTFFAEDIGLAGLQQRYDFACIFEALHDMSRPVEVLAAVRKALVPGGSVLVVDERVAETFTAPGDEIERMMYGWSVLVCLPNGLADEPNAATGTVMREATVRRYAAEAGFAGVDVLDIDNLFFRFYRLST